MQFEKFCLILLVLRIKEDNIKTAQCIANLSPGKGPGSNIQIQSRVARLPRVAMVYY